MKKLLRGIVAVFKWLLELNELVTDWLANGLSVFARRVSLVAVLAVGGGVTYKLATASRNSSGTMSGVSGPYTSGTVISSSVLNARFADIESEISDSKSRSGKGDFSAAVRGADGTVTAPTFAFTSETGTGLYRIGSSDLGVAINQSKKLELTSSLFTVTPASTFTGDVTASGHIGIGGSPSNFLDMTISGTATTNIGNWLQASLADGNSMTLNIGKVASAGGLGIITYKKNATAVNSTLCLDVYGTSAAFCVDGNGKTILGGAGSTLNVSVNGDGSGFKHKRGTTGCTTAAVLSAVCTTTITWTTPFADSNYTVMCWAEGITSGVPATVTAKASNAASAIHGTQAMTAAAAQFSTIDCIAVHD